MMYNISLFSDVLHKLAYFVGLTKMCQRKKIPPITGLHRNEDIELQGINLTDYLMFDHYYD